MLDRPKFRMHVRFSLRVTLKFRGCSILIFQKIPIMLKYNVYLRIQSEVARKQKRAYDINKMSKTFEMTISRLRFSELSLSDHNYFRPTRAREIYDYEPYLKKKYIFCHYKCRFYRSSADSVIPLPIRYFCADSVILCSARARVNDSCACCKKSVVVSGHISGQIDARFISNLDKLHTLRQVTSNVQLTQMELLVVKCGSLVNF